MRRWLVGLVMTLGAALAVACPKPQPPPPAPVVEPPAPAPSKSVEPPLGEVTLQGALEAAWDGDFVLCNKRARTAITIAPTDAESMELMLRCARAAHVLGDADAWVRSAYGDHSAPVVRYAFGITALLRGELSEARAQLTPLVSQIPVAGYHAAIAAQLDDDVTGAEQSLNAYLKVRPNDPLGRALQARLACAIDVGRCASIAAIVRSTDDDETAVVRRLGVGLPWALGATIAVPRASLTSMAAEASTSGAVAFEDAYTLAATIREGADPAGVLVRSPRSGRPEPSPTVDLTREARAISQLPFFTRVVQLEVEGDPKASQAAAQLIALFPVDVATYAFAAKWDHAAAIARRELEGSSSLRWRVIAASLLAKPSEQCELASMLPPDSNGPYTRHLRGRCLLTMEATKARREADRWVADLPFGALDVERAIEAYASARDASALEALGRKISILSPTSALVATAYWSAAELSSAKKQRTLFNEALAYDAYSPERARRLIRRYLDTKDVAGAKATLTQALIESPLDALLCGVEGEILAQEGKSDAALGWLAKACASARSRKEQDVLTSTIATIGVTAPRAKDKAARDAAMKCARGE